MCGCYHRALDASGGASTIANAQDCAGNASSLMIQAGVAPPELCPEWRYTITVSTWQLHACILSARTQVHAREDSDLGAGHPDRRPPAQLLRRAASGAGSCGALLWRHGRLHSAAKQLRLPWQLPIGTGVGPYKPFSCTSVPTAAASVGGAYSYGAVSEFRHRGAEPVVAALVMEESTTSVDLNTQQSVEGNIVPT